MTTLEEATKYQDQLQASGRRLLTEHHLDNILAPLGDVHLDGSFLYGLMVKPDIDYHIYIDSPDIKAVRESVQQLMQLKELVRIHVTNRQDYEDNPPGMPKGIYLGFQIYFEDRLWNFDVWVLNQADKLDTESFPMDWHKQITPTQHDVMLLLKYQLKELDLYPGIGNDKFASADVYRAVMQDGATTVDDMRAWRKTHPYF